VNRDILTRAVVNPFAPAIKRCDIFIPRLDSCLQDGFGRGNWGNLQDEKEAELENPPHESRSKTISVVSAQQFERLMRGD
jgi:hypothetical protein